MDLVLGSRRTLSEEHHLVLEKYVSSLRFPVVYNAFDGDHFALTPLMRRYCLDRGAVPANPESILGYRDTVQARKTKQGVLRDDLAVLRSCDELWIFSDIEPVVSELGRLAEGVLTELCYFVLSKGVAEIRIVPISALVARQNVSSTMLHLRASDLREHVGADMFDEILDFLGGAELDINAVLPDVAYVLTDLQDAKYMHFMREFALTKHGAVGLVPGLAIEIGDVVPLGTELGCLLVSWSQLMRLASQIWVFPTVSNSSEGSVFSLLKSVWLRNHPAKSLLAMEWRDVPIPKVVQGDQWSLTARERKEFRFDQDRYR